MSENSDVPTPPDPPDPPNQPYDYDELKAYHQQIIRLYVAHGGELSQEDIAEKVGVHRQTVYNVLNSRLAQQKIKKLQKHMDSVAMSAMEKVHELQQYSLMELESMLLDETTDPKLKVKIARDILDRGGTKEPERHEVAHAHFTKDDMEEIKERANNTGNVVDIEDKGSEE